MRRCVARHLLSGDLGKPRQIRIVLGRFVVAPNTSYQVSNGDLARLDKIRHLLRCDVLRDLGFAELVEPRQIEPTSSDDAGVKDADIDTLAFSVYDTKIATTGWMRR